MVGGRRLCYFFVGCDSGIQDTECFCETVVTVVTVNFKTLQVGSSNSNFDLYNSKLQGRKLTPGTKAKSTFSSD